MISFGDIECCVSQICFVAWLLNLTQWLWLITAVGFSRLFLMGFLWHILWWGKSKELSIDLKESTVKRKIKKYQVWWIRSHWKTGVNGHCQVCVASPWAAMPEKSPWYRHSTLKLDWSLPLSGGKLCSNVLVGEKLRPFIPSTPHLLSSMVVVVLPWGCVAASGSGALKKVNGIMKEEDNLQIL